MKFREPKDTNKVLWTQHVKEKMKFYGLSETRIRRVLRGPVRIEKGVALRTVAVMQRTGTKKRAGEIWVMYQRKIKSQKSKIKKKEEKIIIISAWRYPGISPAGFPPIPEDIIMELNL